jgi:hypothetical protein
MVEKKIKDLKPLYKVSSFRFEENPEEYEKIYNEIKKNGFNDKVSKIFVSLDNHIINGHHRIEILKKIYGDEYVIKVRRIPVNRFVYLSFMNLLVFLFLPILILLFFINRSIKILRNFKK